MRLKNFNNKKGIGLVELLLVVTVVALTTPLLFWVFMYGIQSFNTYSKYMEQQDKVIDVTQRIRQDIEEAAAYRVDYNAAADDVSESVLMVCIPDASGSAANFKIKVWRFEDGKLLFKSCTGDAAAAKKAALDGKGFEEVLDGLDTAKTVDGNRLTRFEGFASSRRIMLSIKPVSKNTVSYKNRNVNKPIITEYSVEYKDMIE